MGTMLHEETVSFSASAMQRLAEKAFDVCTEYGIKIVLAILLVVVGFKVTHFLIRNVRKSLDKHGVDPSVTGFLASLGDIVCKILIVLTAVRGIGVEVTSFLTILGSAGVALGLALQGSLSNLAGGLLILLLKPYRVGDYIKTQAGSQEGTVISIDIFYTKLKSIDNQIVVIPNGELSNNSIVNVTKEEFRRIDVTVDIAYDSNILEAKNVLLEVCEKNGDVLLDKGLDIFVNELGESGIVMGVHAWVRTQDYWPVRWSLLEQIKLAFDKAGIQIPYKTVDINIVSEPPKGE